MLVPLQSILDFPFLRFTLNSAGLRNGFKKISELKIICKDKLWKLPLYVLIQILATENAKKLQKSYKKVTKSYKKVTKKLQKSYKKVTKSYKKLQKVEKIGCTIA